MNIKAGRSSFTKQNFRRDLVVGAAITSVILLSQQIAIGQNAQPAKSATYAQRNRNAGYVPDTLLVELSDHADTDKLNEVLEETHGSVLRTITCGPTLTILVVSTERGRSEETARKLADSKQIVSIDRDPVCRADRCDVPGHMPTRTPGRTPTSGPPDDRFFPQQSDLDVMQFSQARHLDSRQKRAVNLMFIDSGINPIPDELTNIVQYNCTGSGKSGPQQEAPFDAIGHGTAVASVAAATTNNKIGIAGDSNLEGNRTLVTMLRIANRGEIGVPLDRFLTAMAFLYESKNTRPGPINISWGIDPAFRSLNARRLVQEEAKLLRQRGCLVILASGNGTADENFQGQLDSSPERYARRVTSIAPDGVRSSFADYGPFATAAPGENIPLYIGPESVRPKFMAVGSGTSFSAGLYTGAVGLVQAFLPAGYDSALLADRIVRHQATVTSSGLHVPNLAKALHRALQIAPPPNGGGGGGNSDNDD